MPLVTVTGGPVAPSGRTINTAELVVRYDEAYSDGANTFPTRYHAEYDSSTSGWKPAGAADGTAFQIPAGADGYPLPPGAWLTELQTLDDASTLTSKRGPMRIYESASGVWAYGTPAPDLHLVTSIPYEVPDGMVLVGTNLETANGLEIDGGTSFRPYRNTRAVGGDTIQGTLGVDSAGRVVVERFVNGSNEGRLLMGAPGSLQYEETLGGTAHDLLSGAGLSAGVKAEAIDSEAATDGQVLTADGSGNAAWEDVDGTVTSYSDLPTESSLTIVETSTGVWTRDAPARTAGQYPIEFRGASDPSDGTNGIDTPANINAFDVWVDTGA